MPRKAIRNPWITLTFAALVTLMAGMGLTHLRLRTDAHTLVPPAPEICYDEMIRSQFGVEDNIVVLIRSADPAGIFNPGTLNLVRELTADFKTLPGVNPCHVISLATEPGFRKWPGTINLQRFLDTPMTTRAELARLRADLEAIQLYTGTLVSFDGKSTVILIGVGEDCDRAGFCRRVRRMVATRKPAPEEIAVTGAPVAEAMLGSHILQDLGVPPALLDAGTGWDMPRSRRTGLVPIAILVMAGVFLVAFRKPVAALVPMAGIAATLVSVFGLMGWAGTPIYLTTAIMPILLVATGVTNDVYLFTRYFETLRGKPGVPQVQLLTGTFDQLARAVAMTSLATASGFFSFSFSPIKAVSDFGIWTGIGVLLGLAYSLTIVPAALSLIPQAWLVSGRGLQTLVRSRVAVFFSAFGRSAIGWRWGVISVAVIVAALTPLGLRRLAVQDSWIDAFEPGSEFRRSVDLVNSNFYGVHELFVCVDATDRATGELPAPPDAQNRVLLPGSLCSEMKEIEGSTIIIYATPTNGAPERVYHSQVGLPRRYGTNISVWMRPTDDGNGFFRNVGQAKMRFELAVHWQLRPDIVDANHNLAEFLRQQRDCAVGGVIGPYDYLSTTRFMTQPDDPSSRQLLWMAEENWWLWDYYRFALGEDRLRQVMDTNYCRALTTVFMKDANFVDTGRLIKKIEKYQREHLVSKGLKVGLAGDVAVSQALIGGIVTTQLQSLCWSLAGIFFVTTLLGGSFRWGICCLFPSAFAVLVKFAVLGWLGIPLGVATSMFAAMTLGIGVNCAIQLLEAHTQARTEEASPVEALSRAMALTGLPALINTMAVALGFSVLILSEVPANARLGILLALGLVICFVSSLLLLPVLLHLWDAKNVKAR